MSDEFCVDCPDHEFCGQHGLSTGCDWVKDQHRDHQARPLGIGVPLPNKSIQRQIEVFRFHHGVKPWNWDIYVACGTRVNWELLGWVAESDRLIDEMFDYLKRAQDILISMESIVSAAEEEDDGPVSGVPAEEG
jgi:hypothetical protein